MVLLNELEEAIGGATRVPPMRRGLVDQEKLLDLVDRLRVSVPQGIREADQILEKREAIINQALLEARKIRQTAEDEASKRVHESSVIQEAQAEAADLMSRTEEEAQKLVNSATIEAQKRLMGADKYALEALGQLETDLGTMLTSVRQGIDWLAVQRNAEEQEAAKTVAQPPQ
ncbi:MAG: hypothetical protein C1O27_001356 [Chloroflexi bacterium]|nr:MAG: hypothetical protein C1O27_001356 [Chloroflexota bacterium]